MRHPLLLGYAAALRRSEFAAVEHEHLRCTAEGLELIADRGYDADRVFDMIERQGSDAVIPPRRHRCTKPRAFDAALYRLRHRVEFFFNRLKQFRRVATRYDKTARNYLAMVQIGCVRIWTRFEDAP